MDTEHAVRPLILGIGGTTRDGSTTERAMLISLRAAARLGAEIVSLAGEAIELPMYAPERPARSKQALTLVDLVSRCDGLIVASPGYHGTMSGLVKNALDYIEDLRDDPRPYLHGRAVGCIGCAYGWQAATATLSDLRGVVHALRGWPTPLGAAINSSQATLEEDGACSDAHALAQLEMVGEQVMQFALMTRATRAVTRERV